jgi:hypothetical protein
MTLDGPNQLWVADITYIAITTSFVSRGAACIIPTVGRNTLQKPIALS